MRTAPEEFNLSANQHHQDPTAAEFIRSYMTMSFPGARFVSLLEAESKVQIVRKRQGVLPVRKFPVGHEDLKTYHIEEFFTWLHDVMGNDCSNEIRAHVKDCLCLHTS